MQILMLGINSEDKKKKKTTNKGLLSNIYK